jgi:hypothetical protein
VGAARRIQRPLTQALTALSPDVQERRVFPPEADRRHDEWCPINALTCGVLNPPSRPLIRQVKHSVTRISAPADSPLAAIFEHVT